MSDPADADTNLSNLTTLWLLLGAYMVFLMQVSDDFLFISYHPSFFFRTNWRRLGDILKKCSETTRLKRRFELFFQSSAKLKFFLWVVDFFFERKKN
jgi:hypothetical protein